MNMNSEILFVKHSIPIANQSWVQLENASYLNQGSTEKGNVATKARAHHGQFMYIGY